MLCKNKIIIYLLNKIWIKVNIKYVKRELNSEYWYNICGFIKLVNRSNNWLVI